MLETFLIDENAQEVVVINPERFDNKRLETTTKNKQINKNSQEGVVSQARQWKVSICSANVRER